MKIEMNSIVDFWYCSIFERSKHKRECLLMQVKKTQTWIHGKYIQYYSILFPSRYSLFHRVPWRWRYCKSKQCSNDNFPTFAKPSEVKENTNEQYHFIRYHSYITVYLHYLVCWCRPLAAPAARTLRHGHK